MVAMLQSGAKKILVTGATGFIGRHLCDHLLGRGFIVRALVRESSTTILKPNKNLEQLSGDILDPNFLLKACKDIDAIVHLAGLAHVIRSTHEQLHKINVVGTELLLAAANEQKVERFVYISSSLAETKNSQGVATTAYGRAKLAAEKLVISQQKAGHMNCVILRPVNVYGPGMRGNLALLISLISRRLAFPIPRLQTSISLVGVNDVCDAICLVIMSESVCDKIYTITDGVHYMISDIEEAIYKQAGRNLPTLRVPLLLLYVTCLSIESLRKFVGIFGIRIRLIDSAGMKTYKNLTKDNLFGNEEITRDLGFRPKTNFYQSLAQIIEGMDSSDNGTANER